jgi:hypothetical protein
LSGRLGRRTKISKTLELESCKHPQTKSKYNNKLFQCSSILLIDFVDFIFASTAPHKPWRTTEEGHYYKQVIVRLAQNLQVLLFKLYSKTSHQREV